MLVVGVFYGATIKRSRIDNESVSFDRKEDNRMNFLMVVLFSWGLGCGPKKETQQDPRYLKAEYKRLSQEMERHVSRQRWEKASRVFSEMKALEIDISYDDWVLAAEVNQEIGVIADTRGCLRSAYSIRSTSQVSEWRKLIEDQYGDVVLEVKSNADFDFSAKFEMSDPVKRNAVAFAKAQLEEERKFTGMLPIGTYNFVGEDFDVESGLEIVRSMDPRQRKKGMKKAVMKEFEIPEE